MSHEPYNLFPVVDVPLEILLGRGLIRSERKDKITSVGTELEHIFVHHTM